MVTRITLLLLVRLEVTTATWISFLRLRHTVCLRATVLIAATGCFLLPAMVPDSVSLTSDLAPAAGRERVVPSAVWTLDANLQSTSLFNFVSCSLSSPCYWHHQNPASASLLCIITFDGFRSNDRQWFRKEVAALLDHNDSGTRLGYATKRVALNSP